MTIKGRKGFNRNSDTPSKGSAVLVSNKPSALLDKKLQLGYQDINDIPASFIAIIRSFLNKWGISSESYTLVGAVIKSNEPLIFRPLVILKSDAKVVLLREEDTSSNLNKALELKDTTEVAPFKVFKVKDNRVLLVREFVSNTLGDVFKMSSGFSLQRLVSLLQNTLEGISQLHGGDISHGHLTEWNISAGLENQGCLLDIGLGSASSRKEDDVKEIAKLIEKSFSRIRVSKEELESKRKLQEIVDPLIESMKEEDSSRRPTIEVVRVLFSDLVKVALSDKVENYISNEVNLGEELIVKDPLPEVINTLVEPPTSYGPASETALESSLADVNSYQQKDVLKVSKSTSSLVYMILFSLLIFTSYKVVQRFGFFEGNSNYQIFDGPYLELDQLTLAWSSGVPSKMKEVARQAIYESSAREIAEQVIVSPILLDQNNVRLVDSSLIRVAYSKEWEAQLNSFDRRFILALALRELLQDEFPEEIPPLSELHPAVLLAVLSSTVNKVPAVLDAVPASRLESLPEPFGVAFQILNTGKQEIKASAEEVITLARLGTRGVDDPVLLSRFLKNDFERRLSAIAVMYSINSVESLKVLDTIINHPNVSLSIPTTDWAKKVDLISWNGIDASDKLFLTAGVALRPEKKLTIEQIARLFLNPSPRVRGYAAGLSINQISFKHKGAIEVLTLINKVPDIISAMQLTMLGQILEDPDKTIDAHIKVIRNFIGSEPPMEIAKTLLLSSVESSSNTILDASLSAYLNEKGWVPDQAELKILVNHHDKVARMLAYQAIFKAKESKENLNLLKECLAKESVQEFKEQLKTMIEKLESSSK